MSRLQELIDELCPSGVEFKTLEDFEAAQLAIENDFNKKFLNFRYYYTTYDRHMISAVNMHAEDLDGKEIVTYPLMEGDHILMQNL